MKKNFKIVEIFNIQKLSNYELANIINVSQEYYIKEINKYYYGKIKNTNNILVGKDNIFIVTGEILQVLNCQYYIFDGGCWVEFKEDIVEHWFDLV